MEEGWLRLWRKARDSRVFNDPDPWLWKVWSFCLMEACYTECWQSGRKLMPGQFTLGRISAAGKLGMSPSRLYRALQTLSGWGQITLEANSRFTVVTVCNWQAYNPEGGEVWTAVEQPVNSRRTAGEHPLLSEELEEGKNAPPRVRAFVKPTLEEVTAYCRERGNTVDPAAWLAHYESNGWRVGRTPMKDWRAAVRTWERNVNQFGNGKVQGPQKPPETAAERMARVASQRAQAAREAAQKASPEELAALRASRANPGKEADP